MINRHPERSDSEVEGYRCATLKGPATGPLSWRRLPATAEDGRAPVVMNLYACNR